MDKLSCPVIVYNWSCTSITVIIFPSKKSRLNRRVGTSRGGGGGVTYIFGVRVRGILNNEELSGRMGKNLHIVLG
jgi:hypothetical protein